MKDEKNFSISPRAIEWPNRRGGTVMGFDSTVTRPGISDVIEHASRAYSGRSINVFVGVHGAVNGDNWVRLPGKKGRWITGDEKSSWLFSEMTKLYKNRPDIKVHDVERISADNFKTLLAEDEGINLLGWCFSVADSVANEVRSSLNVGDNISYTIYSRAI